MKLDRHTSKLYYSDFFLSEVNSKIVKTGEDYLELESTVAYPEGGGQEADHGVLVLADGRTLRFIWAKKMYAHSSGLVDFPDVQVQGVIWHMIHPEDQHLLLELMPGLDVTVKIDIERRARLSLSHTASHLLYLAVGQYRPDAIPGTIGCHIKTDGARFDFSVESRITADELMLMEQTANAYQVRNSPVTVSAHQQVPDARLWHCEGQVIPCGGTHLDHLVPIGPLQLRRRGLGAGKERISCTFEQAKPELTRYHG
jgi:Ser-tRNA(Ala) deacylase AlaX